MSIGHEGVKQLVRAYLETWVPIRLELIRQALEVDTPDDPRAVILADGLPNDPEQYPCVMVMSTRIDGMGRRQAVADGEVAEYDVDYVVKVVVAVQRGEYQGDDQAVLDRDRLLLAVRECVMLPAPLSDQVFILSNPAPEEETGAAAKTVRDNPLAAGTVTFLVRAAEALMPTSTLQAILDGTVDIAAHDSTKPAL
ncbi:MAG: hypothetical protein GC157_07185 [Frankiales bacterium]|nr:hypothetical protein [Frankiales bacterium]